MNIRRVGRAKDQRMKWAIPVVHQGDFVASRDNEAIFHRQPWEGGPFVRVPLGDPSLVDTVTGYVEQQREEAELGVASAMVERLRPYLIWGVVGSFAMALIFGYIGYELGRGE